jgi:aminoglycoside phosphotransferase (APT) family kinase protein
VAEPGLAERLERFLASEEPGRRPRVRECRPISGGYSRVSAIAEVAWSDGEVERLVLRGDPPPGVGVFSSDRDAEWVLLRALRGVDSVSVANPRYYDSDGRFFGTRCIVMEYVDGRPLQGVAAEPGAAQAAAVTFVDTVAGIHATPLTALPAGLSVPTDLDSYLDEVGEAYLRVEREISESSPLLRYVVDVLREYRPPPVPFTLVHGDCQPGNLLVGSGRRPVTIDWEFARVGDPREDLGYYRQIPLEPNLYLTDPAAFLDRYRERTGLTEEQVNPAVVDYFLLVGLSHLLAQILRAVDSVAAGQRRGALATYLISAVSLQYDLFFTICRRLERSGEE